jgi:putative membrane protein
MMNRTKWLFVAGLVGSGLAYANNEQQGAMTDQNTQPAGQTQEKSQYDKNFERSYGKGYGGAGQGHTTGTGSPTAGMEKEHRDDMATGGAGMATGQVDPQLASSLMKLHASNLAEIQMAELARDRAQSKDVKKFAEHILKDHQMADKKVMDHARTFNIDMQRGMNDPELQQMQQETQTHMTTLQGLNGAEFDRQYVTINLQAHEKTVAMVTEANNMFRDRKEGKIFGEMLPKLQQHRDHAQKLMDKGMKTGAARRGPPVNR